MPGMESPSCRVDLSYPSLDPPEVGVLGDYTSSKVPGED